MSMYMKRETTILTDSGLRYQSKSCQYDSLSLYTMPLCDCKNFPYYKNIKFVALV